MAKKTHELISFGIGLEIAYFSFKINLNKTENHFANFMCFCTRLLHLPPSLLFITFEPSPASPSSSFSHFIHLYIDIFHSHSSVHPSYTHSMLQWFLPLAIEMIFSLSKFASFRFFLLRFELLSFSFRFFWFARKGFFIFVL